VSVERVRLYDDVVHIYLYTPTDQILKDLVHKPLVGRSSVIQAERHDLVVVVGVNRHERCLLFVPRVHAYLVVARVSV